MNKCSGAGLDNSSDPKRKLATGIAALLLIFAIGFALDAASCAMDDARSQEAASAEDARQEPADADGGEDGRDGSHSESKADAASEDAGFDEDELVRLGKDIRIAGFSKLSALGTNRSSLGDALSDALSKMGFEPSETVLICARDAEADQAHMTAWFEVAGAGTYLKGALVGAGAWEIAEVEDASAEADPAEAGGENGKAEAAKPEKEEEASNTGGGQAEGDDESR